MSKKDENDNLGKLLLYGAILIILIGISCISGIVKMFSGESNSADSHEDDTKTDIVEDSTQESPAITQNIAEDYCQDAALLGRYLNLNNLSIVSVWDYNVQFFGDDKGELGFDAEGDPQYELHWNGKDKVTKKLIPFSCYISGTKDNIKLQWLVANLIDLYGSAADYATYNAAGEKIE